MAKQTSGQIDARTYGAGTGMGGLDFGTSNIPPPPGGAFSHAEQQPGSAGGGAGGTTAAGYAPSPGGGGAGATGTLRETGEGLIDPNSEYSKMMRERLTGDIGQDTEAQRRLASFDAAQSGMGAGGSPELSSMLGDIGIAGSERTGEGMLGLATRGTEMGLGALGTAQQGEMGYAGMDLEKELAGKRDTLARWQTEQQKGEAQQSREMESWYSNRQFELQEQQQREEAKWREFTMSQGMGGEYGGGGGYGGGGEEYMNPNPYAGGVLG